MKYTKTSTFIYPFLQIPKTLFECEVRNAWGNLVMSTRFIDAFLGNQTDSRYSDDLHISIIINNYRDVDFDAFYSELTTFENYVTDYEQEGLLIAVFKMPVEYHIDVLKIIEGKYSQISEGAKQCIYKHCFYGGKLTTIPLILTKSPKLKTQLESVLATPGSHPNIGENEVWSIMDKEKETLTVELLKSYSKISSISPSAEFE